MELYFYTVDPAYRSFLKKIILDIDDEKKRPYVGVVLEINNFKYFVPLTSTKSKHANMSNKQIDFLKIGDGSMGAMNFNKMIPVPYECLTEVNANIEDNDTKKEKAYKKLLMKQILWCNSNSKTIYRKARTLYTLIIKDKLDDRIKRRCYDFLQVEELCRQYRKDH